VVYKAKDTQTNEEVAVKKIKIGSRQEAADGINLTALREIKFLQEVKHPNVIEVSRRDEIDIVHCVRVLAARFIWRVWIEQSKYMLSLRVHEHGFGSRLFLGRFRCLHMTNLLLQNIINNRSILLTTTHVKAYMIMLLLGLEYLHSNWILHRVREERFHC
jgi:cyclin-dependent kinase 7